MVYTWTNKPLSNLLSFVTFGNVSSFAEIFFHLWQTLGTYISCLDPKPATGCGGRSSSLWIHWNLLWQLSRDGNTHRFGHVTCHDRLPKPSFGALKSGGGGVEVREGGDAVVGREK